MDQETYVDARRAFWEQAFCAALSQDCSEPEAALVAADGALGIWEKRWPMADARQGVWWPPGTVPGAVLPMTGEGLTIRKALMDAMTQLGYSYEIHPKVCDNLAKAIAWLEAEWAAR